MRVSINIQSLVRHKSELCEKKVCHKNLILWNMFDIFASRHSNMIIFNTVKYVWYLCQ